MLKYSIVSYIPQGFPGGSVIIKKTNKQKKQKTPANAGEKSLIPSQGRRHMQ